MKQLLKIILLILPVCSNSQPVKPLRIGDTVPAAAYAKLTTTQPSTINAKLIILDFWATWCTSCLQAFPKLEALQQQFASDLQLVLVNAKTTGDDSKKISGFFARRKNSKGRPYAFSSLTEDTVFSQLFAHKMVPHYVWLDAKGVVKAITGSGEVNAQNINALINNGEAAMRTKADLSYDLTRPFFVHNNAGAGANLIHRSLLTGYTPGMPSFIGKTAPTDSLARIYAMNSSAENLYKLAYPYLNTIPANRLLLQVREPRHYRLTGEPGIWKYDHAYTYELLLPQREYSKLENYMRQDLDRYFGMRLTRETREMECYIITKTTNHLSRSIKQPLKNKKTNPRHQQTVSLGAFIKDLDRHQPIPVINETGLTDYPILPPGTFSNMQTIRQSLERQGFNIELGCCPVEVYVLTEKDSAKQ